jgi:hypothetical protein
MLRYTYQLRRAALTVNIIAAGTERSSKLGREAIAILTAWLKLAFAARPSTSITLETSAFEDGNIIRAGASSKMSFSTKPR